MAEISSNLSRADFISKVERAQKYIRAGRHLSGQPFAAAHDAINFAAGNFFEKLCAVSPAPFSAFLDCGEFQIASSSPEQFLRMSGSQIITRPIKGTRPRDADATRDAQLAYELQTSAKELAELVMITDLLRNDLGKVCEYGSVQVPELAQAGKIRAGAASGFDNGRPVAKGRDAFCRVRLVFSRRQHHRRAEISRDGNH